MIGIAKNGRWDADAVNHFQRGLREKIKSNLAYTVKKLNDLDQTEIKDFWRFYYDGPHPESYQERFNILQPKVASLDQHLGELFKEAYEELLAESDGPLY